MDLWLIRHPRPAVAPDTCYGQLDLALAEGALAEARGRLPPLPRGARLRSSPARRCRALADLLDAVPVSDPRLLERSFGAWEGRAWDAIGRAAIDAWAADPRDYTPPGGESARALLDRVGAVLAEELALGGSAIWVTHQGVARAVAGHLLEGPENQWLSLRLDFGGVWHFSRAPRGWQLQPLTG